MAIKVRDCCYKVSWDETIFYYLDNMLSIRVLECSISLEGALIYGRRKLAYIVSKKTKESPCVSCFNRIILTLPIKIFFYFCVRAPQEGHLDNCCQTQINSYLGAYRCNQQLYVFQMKRIVQQK